MENQVSTKLTVGYSNNLVEMVKSRQFERDTNDLDCLRIRLPKQFIDLYINQVSC